MSNILLVSATIEDASRSPTINPNSHYPIGLAYIHSYLEKQGHRVQTLFLNDYPFESCRNEVRQAVQQFSPDFVGFQIITHNRSSSFALMQEIHESFPHIRLVIGGIHVTLMYEQILQVFPYLIAVIGEGELTFAELIRKCESGDSIENVHGIAFNQSGSVVRTPPRELIRDLDTLPFPKHELFVSPERTFACILTSRGCPCACSFCVLDRMSKRQVRFRSVENVLEEIGFIEKTFPSLHIIWIHDDSFFLNNQRVIQLCDEIVRRNIKLKFICSGRFKPLTKDVVSALERAGFIQVLFGLESGAKEVLGRTRKGITKEDAVHAFRLFAHSPIQVTAFLIVGLPGENDQTVQETAEFVQQLQKIKYSYFDDIGVLAIYPGTEIYEIAKKAGKIDDSYWLSDKSVPLFTAEHPEKKLLEYKEYIRDHIAFKKAFSLKGYQAQRSMIPFYLRHFFRFVLFDLIKKAFRKAKRKLGILPK